ncbi:unnamed protein product [Cyprideis torosa]|uniref:Uncharacterized protein n=1 Tax=Cyprideis torosa TaxID=163714 RepID=A0A7R8W8D7_9CRUS|nr:unnamed protein product [Cyprideis torosa]CAG0888454.1 unnamed protein product [Cyprideis torosa]
MSQIRTSQQLPSKCPNFNFALLLLLLFLPHFWKSEVLALLEVPIQKFSWWPPREWLKSSALSLTEICNDCGDNATVQPDAMMNATTLDTDRTNLVLESSSLQETFVQNSTTTQSTSSSVSSTTSLVSTTTVTTSTSSNESGNQTNACGSCRVQQNRHPRLLAENARKCKKRVPRWQHSKMAADDRGNFLAKIIKRHPLLFQFLSNISNTKPHEIPPPVSTTTSTTTTSSKTSGTSATSTTTPQTTTSAKRSSNNILFGDIQIPRSPSTVILLYDNTLLNKDIQRLPLHQIADPKDPRMTKGYNGFADTVYDLPQLPPPFPKANFPTSRHHMGFMPYPSPSLLELQAKSSRFEDPSWKTPRRETPLALDSKEILREILRDYSPLCCECIFKCNRVS